MNNIQAKLLSAVLLPAGMALSGYGGYQLYLAWDHNQNLSKADQTLGGLISTVNDALGTNMAMSYQAPGLFFGAGLVLLVIGWLTLGRIK